MDPEWFRNLLHGFNQLFPDGSFLSEDYNVKGLVAVLIVSLVCGSVGSLVVGNRMAFFSDALAHCTFTGVALGLLVALATGRIDNRLFLDQGIPLIMVVFGVLVGLGIAFVRDKTSLASDSVIGVFFAGAMGFGAMILKFMRTRTTYNPENFLFGDLGAVQFYDLLVLFLLAVVTAVVLAFLFNQLVFTSFNVSLARSRRLRVQLCSYLFIVLLALIVNLCFKTVGALLIHSLLVVPAATAGNLARNMRQMFWLTTGLCLLAGILGQWLCWEGTLFFEAYSTRVAFGPGGTIVCLSVVFFFLSMVFSMAKARWRRMNVPSERPTSQAA
jgi:zinc transport system permease protein